MEVQTQIMAPNPADDQMAADSRVAGYKNELASIRSKIVTVLEEKKAVIGSLKEVLSARSDAIALFQDEAQSVYPELSGKDAVAEVKTVSPDHPLAQMWAGYQSTLLDFDKTIAVRVEEYKSWVEAEQVLHDEAKVVLYGYSEFAKISPAPVPSVEDLEAELAVEEVIPFVEESSLIASVSALDLMDTEAQGLITREMATEHSEEVALELRDKKIDKRIWIAAGIVGLLFLFRK
jgi:hypothetical protein